MSENEENISLDEMMKNLKRDDRRAKAAELGEGELVTRSDGSKALKVKTRKRRSEQTKKSSSSKSMKRKLIALGSLVTLLILAGIGFAFLLGYYNGTRFNAKLKQAITANTGAEAELSTMQVSVSRAKIGKLKLDWQGELGLIKSIEAKSLNADYSGFSFLGGGWTGSELAASTVNVKLNLVDSQPAFNLTSGPSVDYAFRVYLSPIVNVDFAGSSEWEISETAVEVQKNEAGEQQVYINGGGFKTPMGSFRIKNGLLKFDGSKANINLRVTPLDSNGSIKFVGDVGYVKGSPILLNTDFEKIALASWIDPSTKRFFDGEITRGNGTISFQLGDTKRVNISTKVISNSIQLDQFAFISELDVRLSDKYFNKPNFTNGSSARVIWSPDVTKVTEINLVEEAKLKVKGQFQIKKQTGALSGQFQLGIPFETIERTKLALFREVFDRSEGHFVWATIQLSGSVTSPKDNLEAQFKAAIKKFKDIEEAAKNKDSLDLLQ